MNLTTRLAVGICGLITLGASRAYYSLGHFDSEIHTSVFVACFLASVGIAGIAIACLPVRRIVQTRYLLPWLIAFAAIGYGTTAALILVPATTLLSKSAVFSVCPACVFTITVDPSTSAVLFGLAPMNAAIFGAVGSVIGVAAGAKRPAVG